MAAQNRERLALASVFAGAAARYWLGVFPIVGRELRLWRQRARQIPDPVLRRLALVTQDDERGNLEGAAAFAVLVPRAHRERVVRAMVAFQAAYDYIDTLAEQPSVDPVANGHQLHLALLTALDPDGEHADYYEHAGGHRDNGYIRSLVDTCRFAFAALPSQASVAEPALRAARRMVAYQALNHDTRGNTRGALAKWASTLTPAGTGLRWWETAAGAASSLTVFALIAAAAQPFLDAGEAAATESAYFPWIGALHVLLDSLIDRAEDLDSGHHCLVDHYASDDETASRLGAIASHAMHATELLPKGVQHATILAGMTSFYLSAPGVASPASGSTARRVLEPMGALAVPTMTVLRARRAAERLLGRSDNEPVESPHEAAEAVATPAGPDPVKFEQMTRDSSIGLSTCSHADSAAIISSA
jgi:tetraprenyl-beta-curcumene synthase